MAAVAGSQSNVVQVWDWNRWQCVAEFRGCSDRTEGLEFTPDGKFLVCVGGSTQSFMGGEIQFWNTRSWKSSLTIDYEKINSEQLYTLGSVACSPDGNWLATGSACSGTGKEMRLWKATKGKITTKGKCERNFQVGEDSVKTLAFSPDSKLLAIGVPGDRSVSVCLIPSGRKRWQVKAHSDCYQMSVRFSPDSKLVASCGDKIVALWDAKTGKRHSLLKGHSGPVSSIAFSDDGELLFSSSPKEICVWDVERAVCLGKEPLKGLTFGTIGLGKDELKLAAVHSRSHHMSACQYAFNRDSLRAEPDRPVVAKPRAESRSKQEQQYINAILADPDNDGPRLDYAKWLDERKDVRGEFIRIQCEIAENPKARNKRLRDRQRKILKENFEQWTAPLASLELDSDSCEFRRGFLWELRLNDISVTNKSLKLLEAFPELEQLDLSESAVTGKGVQAIAKIKNLRSLVIDDTSIAPKALSDLRHLKRLVKVHNYLWGNKPIAEIEKLKQARNRRFSKLPDKQQRGEAIHALKILIEYLNADKKGKYPRISYSQSWCSDADLFYLQAISEVEEVDLFECRAVTQLGLKHLKKVPNLKRLGLSETGVTDLQPLQHLTKLEELNLDSLPSLDPKSFRYLPKLKNLRILSIRFNDLSDEVLPHLAKCTSLRELYICNNKFSKEGLALLKGLKLKKLEN